jgi:hypothetical protein
MMEILTESLGMSVYTIIIIIVALSAIIIAAKSVLISIMYSVLMFLSLFLVYYEAHTYLGYTEVNFSFPLIGLILSIMLLSIALLVSYKSSGGMQIA